MTHSIFVSCLENRSGINKNRQMDYEPRRAKEKKNGFSYNLAMFDGRSAGTLSKPTSRQTSVSSSTLPEHLQPRTSQTAQILRTDAPYEPYCFSALSYSSCASRSEFVDGITTDSRMRSTLAILLWPAADFIVFVVGVLVVVVAVTGANECVSMAMVDANGIRDDGNEDDGTLCVVVVSGCDDVDDADGDDDDDDNDDSDDDDSADVEMQ